MAFNFELSPDQQEIQGLAYRFAKEQMRPYAGEFDEKQTLPLHILESAWQTGLMNSCIPTEFGGSGLPTLDGAMISEALAYGCMGMNTSMMANDLALLPLALSNNTHLKKKFLTQFTEKFQLASFCLTEPDYGSDAAHLKTSFKEIGNEIEITGQKMWITNAGHATLFVVYGTFDSKLEHKGIAAICVEADRAGITIGKPEHKMGHRCSDTRAVTFQSVRVPKENLIAGPGEGWKLAMNTLDHSRPLVAASAVGGAQSAMDHAAAYALQRKQFSKPIAEHQAIQMIIADMAMKIEASRLLVYKSAWLLDEHQSNTEFASYAKAFAADSLMEIATQAVQVFGGYGYSTEYPVEKIMRDAKLIQIYEGTSQIQRLVIAREVFKKHRV